MKVKSMYPTITYGWLREAADEAERAEHIEGMEQLLQSQFECICQLSETLQEYEAAMQQMTAERNRYEELYKMLSARIRKAYWELC